MAYEPQGSPGHRLGIYADKIEAERGRRGLDESGFQLDADGNRIDPLKEEKEEMLRRIQARGYR